MKDELIKEAFAICDEEDRSTEYMLQFAQDYADCSFDDVMNYIKKNWKTRKPEKKKFKSAPY